jgi:hypothetical protein
MTSRIDRLLKVRQTGNAFPVKQPFVRAEIDECNLGGRGVAAKTTAAMTQIEYELRLSVFTRFYANSDEYGRAKQNAIRQIKHELYKDVLSSLYAALKVCGEDIVRENLYRAIDGILGE